MVKRNLLVRILAWIAGGTLVCSAQDTPLFRTDISLVRVDAEVTDGTQLLAGLHKEDFLIKDNGQPQPILYFSQDVLPLDLILLFDISGSMRPNVQKAAVTARVALAELHRADRVAIMTFHSRSQVVGAVHGRLGRRRTHHQYRRPWR